MTLPPIRLDSEFVGTTIFRSTLQHHTEFSDTQTMYQRPHGACECQARREEASGHRGAGIPVLILLIQLMADAQTVRGSRRL